MSCCVWMVPVSLWTATKRVTGPEWLLTPLWLGMIAKLMTSGAFSQKRRYLQALLSFPCHPSSVPWLCLLSPVFCTLWCSYLLIIFSLWQSNFGVGTTSDFHLFGPPGKKDPVLKDLLFKDSAIMLKRVPELMDSQLYLGFEYYSAIQSLRKGGQDVMYRCSVSGKCIEGL